MKLAQLTINQKKSILDALDVVETVSELDQVDFIKLKKQLTKDTQYVKCLDLNDKLSKPYKEINAAFKRLSNKLKKYNFDGSKQVSFDFHGFTFKDSIHVMFIVYFFAEKRNKSIKLTVNAHSNFELYKNEDELFNSIEKDCSKELDKILELLKKYVNNDPYDYNIVIDHFRDRE